MKRYLFIGFLCATVSTIAQRIPLTPKNLANANAKGDERTLVDEYDVSGDPAGGPNYSGTPSSYFPNSSSDVRFYYPLRIIIDLFGEYDLSSIYYYDVSNSDSLSISYGTPDAWIRVASNVTNQNKSWVGAKIDRRTRYLMLDFKSPNSQIAEIMLYGTLSGNASYPSQESPIVMPRQTMENIMGINSFVDVPDSLSKVVLHTREYHDWQWDEGDLNTSYPGFPNNQYGWQPSWAGGNFWNFDTYYARSTANGRTVSPCLQKTALYMVNYNGGQTSFNPVRGNKNQEDPASYIEHADYMYQFAARYGSTQVPTSNLKLRSNNPAKSGLGLVKYIENWNEPENRWNNGGVAAFMLPFKLAAMTSADFDGHKGKLGLYGMKNADPQVKLVMAGLTNPDTNYVKSMIFWFNYFRGGSIPFEVLNFHHYSNDVGGQGGGTHGISPEDDRLKDRVKAVARFRDKHLPGKELWFSEFGYDTDGGSPQASRPIGSQDAWEVQARWLIRSYLAFAAGGVDRAHQYMLRDGVDNSNSLFMSSGLTTVNKNATHKAYTKKKSWYYLYAFRKRMTGYRFREEVSSGNNNVFIYAFENASDPLKLVYVVWAPTSTDQTVSNYRLNLPSSTSRLSKVELANKDTLGLEESLTFNNSSLSITVDEKPDMYFIQTTLTTALDEYTAPVEVFQVYPNPFANELNVSLSSSTIVHTVRLRDVRGVVVKSFSEDQLKGTLHLDELAKGVYVLEGIGAQQVYTKKVIKN